MTARHRSSELTATLGGLALLVGVFAPLADVDVWGSVSLFDVSETQGLALLAVGAGTLLAVFIGATRWLPLCALAAWAALLLPLLRAWLGPRDDSALGQLTEAASGLAQDTFGDIALDVAMDITRLSWGGVALLGGCVLLTVAALRRR